MLSIHSLFSNSFDGDIIEYIHSLLNTAQKVVILSNNKSAWIFIKIHRLLSLN